MLDEFKTETRQQGLIFRGIEAGMVQRITSIRANALAMTETGIEHQDSGRCRVCGKNGKHQLLIFVPEMKETVPSQYPAKLPTKDQRPHIADYPLLIRHPGLAQRYERGGTVHARDAKALCNHVKRNGRAAPAAKIKNSRTTRKKAQKALDKGFVDPPRGTTVSVP